MTNASPNGRDRPANRGRERNRSHTAPGGDFASPEPPGETLDKFNESEPAQRAAGAAAVDNPEG